MTAELRSISSFYFNFNLWLHLLTATSLLSSVEFELQNPNVPLLAKIQRNFKKFFLFFFGQPRQHCPPFTSNPVVIRRCRISVGIRDSLRSLRDLFGRNQRTFIFLPHLLYYLERFASLALCCRLRGQIPVKTTYPRFWPRELCSVRFSNFALSFPTIFQFLVPKVFSPAFWTLSHFLLQYRKLSGRFGVRTKN